MTDYLPGGGQFGFRTVPATAPVADRVSDARLAEWVGRADYWRGRVDPGEFLFELELLDELLAERDSADDLAGRLSCLRDSYSRLTTLNDTSYALLLEFSREWRQRMEAAESELDRTRNLLNRRTVFMDRSYGLLSANRQQVMADFLAAERKLSAVRELLTESHTGQVPVTQLLAVLDRGGEPDG